MARPTEFDSKILIRVMGRHKTRLQEMAAELDTSEAAVIRLLLDNATIDHGRVTNAVATPLLRRKRREFKKAAQEAVTA